MLKFLAAAAVVVSMLPGVTVQAQSGDPIDRIERAIELLEQEFELLQVTHPVHAGTEGYDAARSELLDVDREGVLILAELQSFDLPLTTAIIITLGALRPPPPDREAPERDDRSGDDRSGRPPREHGKPPPPELYGTAIVDLKQLSANLTATGTPGAPPATSPSDTMRLALITVGAALAVAAIVSVVIRRRRQYQAALGQALTDPLTDLANRRRLESDISSWADAHDVRVAVLMIDIDHFKHFNDAHGHHVGDAVLRRVADRLAGEVRPTDVVYRYGGEEFCILLPNVAPGEAHSIAERLRWSVSGLSAPGSAPITISIGLAESRGPNTRETLQRADQALYRAKQDGRDRTIIGAAQ